MYHNNHYCVESWDETRGLWIDHYQTRDRETAFDVRDERSKAQPGQWRIVWVTSAEVKQVA